MTHRRKGLGALAKLLWAAAPALLCLSLTLPVSAKPAWDQAANIKDAARRLAILHRTEGSQGVVKFLDACYKTHTIASEFTQGLEACMAQDYMHSRVLAEIYAKLPEEARRKYNAPSASLISNTMNARFAAIMSQYKLTQSETDSLKKNIDKNGLPIFIQTAFPPHKNEEKKGEEADGKDDTKAAPKKDAK